MSQKVKKKTETLFRRSKPLLQFYQQANTKDKKEIKKAGLEFNQKRLERQNIFLSSSEKLKNTALFKECTIENLNTTADQKMFLAKKIKDKIELSEIEKKNIFRII